MTVIRALLRNAIIIVRASEAHRRRAPWNRRMTEAAAYRKSIAQDCFVVGSAFAAESARPRRLRIAPKRKSAARSGNSRRSPCHLANLYQESAIDAESRGKRAASGSKLYRHVATSLAGRGKVTVEGSSKGRKIMSAAGQGSLVPFGLLPLLQKRAAFAEIIPT